MSLLAPDKVVHTPVRRGFDPVLNNLWIQTF
jgi:hypothetical protein